MMVTIKQIAELCDGIVEGDEKIEISGVSKIEEGKPNTLSFLSNPKYTQYIYTTNASAVIVNNEFTPTEPISATLIKVPDSYQAFSSLLSYFNQYKNHKLGIEEPHFIDKSAKVGSDIYIGAFAYLGKNVIIGDDVKIFPNVFIGDNVTIGNNTVLNAGVRIYSDTQIGENCIIHSGTVIGSDGFGYAPNENGAYKKIPQIGNVQIGNDVEIGASTVIDRATLGSTVIEDGVKIDNLVQIAHNVIIGKHTAIASQVGIAGSTKIGKHCLLGGQVGIIGHIVIGDYVKIQAQSGVTKSLKDHDNYRGTPAIPFNDYNKSYVYFKKLPDLVQQLKSLEQEVKALKENRKQ